MASLLPGDVPLVSAKNTNNGFKGFVEPRSDSNIFIGHCLTINNDGDGGAGIAYYQPAKMLLDTHVTDLIPNKSMKKETMLFIASCITVQRDKFGHGYSLNNARLSVFRVMLPIDNQGQPDYTFMEEYIREREKNLVQKYIKHIDAAIRNCGSIVPLDQKEWRTFILSDLFKLAAGKCSQANRLVKTNENCGIPYIGATNRNNGVLYFVKPVQSMISPGNAIAFVCDGEGSMGYSFYKEEPTIATINIIFGYSPFLNKYNAIFITTIADTVRGKYNYNYKRRYLRLKNELLQLPTDENGEPDWVYMEAYVKNSLFQVRQKYLQTKIEVTHSQFEKHTNECT